MVSDDDDDNVIDLQQARDERGLWVNGWAQCSICGRTWVAMVPIAYDGRGLHCPSGHRHAGLWPVRMPGR